MKKTRASVVRIDRKTIRRDRLIAEYLYLVRAIAVRVWERLPPSFDLDDLVGVGNLALLDLATRYDPAAHGGTPFAAFARHRIRGAMLDSIKGKRYIENTRAGFDEGDTVSPLVQPTVEISIDRARQAVRLRDAVSYLPPAERAMIERRYFDGHARGSLPKGHDAALASLRRRLAYAA